MRSSEFLAFAYLGVMTVLAWVRPLPLDIDRRLRISIVGVAAGGAVFGIAHHASRSIKDVAPAVMILIGYYLSGLFVDRPSRRLEGWLIAWDRRLLGNPATRFAHWPRAVLAFLDIIYMGCFLLVPAGFVALVATGHQALVDRYWTMVVAAELGSFVSLSLIQTRPPWALERERAPADHAIHRLASRFVRQFTIRANTLPSGHVAGSLAVALAVTSALPLTGAVLLVLAVFIAVASVVGRYHYVIDVVAGAALALGIWAAVMRS